MVDDQKVLVVDSVTSMPDGCQLVMSGITCRWYGVNNSACLFSNIDVIPMLHVVVVVWLFMDKNLFPEPEISDMSLVE